MPPPLAALPWGHNVLLIEKLKDPAERLWYAGQALENGWSRAILSHQIDSDLHRRQGQALTNKEAFGEFLASATLTGDQIRFIDPIIDQNARGDRRRAPRVGREDRPGDPADQRERPGA